MSINYDEIKDWNVYKITSPSNRIYIGITSNFHSRMYCYKSQDKNLRNQTAVYNSINKYGYQCHKIEIIDKFTSNLSYANGKEIFWIRSFMSHKNKYPDQNGLNLTDGGEGVRGYKATQESRDKNRLNKLGKKATIETRKKISDALKGRVLRKSVITEEERAKKREQGLKLRHTDEAKAKIGKASIGNKYALGYKMTPEQIEHRSSMIRGRKITGVELDKLRQRVINIFGKPIIQYDLNGDFINEFSMIKEASEKIGIPKLGIQRVLSGKYKQSRGFTFKYK